MKPFIRSRIAAGTLFACFAMLVCAPLAQASPVKSPAAEKLFEKGTAPDGGATITALPCQACDLEQMVIAGDQSEGNQASAGASSPLTTKKEGGAALRAVELTVAVDSTGVNAQPITVGRAVVNNGFNTAAGTASAFTGDSDGRSFLALTA